MKIQIGAGSRPLPGFINIEPRPTGRNMLPGHAADLSFAVSRSVDCVFLHAVLEHLYLRQAPHALNEWARVLSADGAVVALGVPDFEVIAKLYLDGAPGVVSSRFDLFEVYRYTHGMPEMDCDVVWPSWNPRRHLNSAPRGWLPQLHKALFDSRTCRDLFESSGLTPTLVRYAYPGEMHALNLGIVAGHREMDALDIIRTIPSIEQFVDLESIQLVPPEKLPDGRSGLVSYALDPGSQASVGLVRSTRTVAGNLKDWVTGLRYRRTPTPRG